MTTAHKDRAVGMSAAFAAPYGLDPNRTRITPREPDFIATVKARAAVRAVIAKQSQMAQAQEGAPLVRLELRGTLWRAVTAWGALVESHEVYTECARRAKLQGFVTASPA